MFNLTTMAEIQSPGRVSRIISTNSLADVVHELFPIINLNETYRQFIITGRGKYDRTQDNVPLNASIRLFEGTIQDGQAEVEFRLSGWFPKARQKSKKLLMEVKDYLAKNYPEGAVTSTPESYALLE
ncbi:MAG TPA: hypothetical protein VJJ52_07625 [Candidatus Nanoarchaeia archaeon]|nr:hypothetical protein [Candidatus Nanoarchaeia archaeon]